MRRQGASSPIVLEAYHDKYTPKKKKGHTHIANNSATATARGAIVGNSSAKPY